MPSLFATLAFLLLTPPALQQAPPAANAPVPAADAPAAPVEDPAVTALALKIYAQMRAGKVDTTLLTPEMNTAATPEILAQMKPMFDTLGDPKTLKLEAGEKLGKGMSYLYLAIFPTAQFHITLFITEDGKVGGYKLKP